MKKISLQLIFWILISNSALAQTNVYDSIYVGGRWRTFLTHLPTVYNPSTNYPLVLAFHGGKSSGLSINSISIRPISKGRLFKLYSGLP